MKIPMGNKVMNKPSNPIPPSPEPSSWKRYIGANPMMHRKAPPDNKIIPIFLLFFTESFLAVFSKIPGPPLMNHNPPMFTGGVL